MSDLMKDAMEMLDNVLYWETCPEDYKERICKLKKALEQEPHPSSVHRLTVKEERALINPIMHEYGISAAPFLELIDKVQDAMMKSNGGEL